MGPDPEFFFGFRNLDKKYVQWAQIIFFSFHSVYYVNVLSYQNQDPAWMNWSASSYSWDNNFINFFYASRNLIYTFECNNYLLTYLSIFPPKVQLQSLPILCTIKRKILPCKQCWVSLFWRFEVRKSKVGWTFPNFVRNLGFVGGNSGGSRFLKFYFAKLGKVWSSEFLDSSQL